MHEAGTRGPCVQYGGSRTHMSTQGATRARDDHTSQAPPASRATRASSTCSRPRPPIPVPWEARGAAPCPPTSQNHPPTCRDDLAEVRRLVPEQTDKFRERLCDSVSSPLTNGFRLQPEELEVGTKLLIFVYLTLSEYTISRSRPHGVQHLTCLLAPSWLISCRRSPVSA